MINANNYHYLQMSNMFMKLLLIQHNDHLSVKQKYGLYFNTSKLSETLKQDTSLSRKNKTFVQPLFQ
jgi:hypothetical protein